MKVIKISVRTGLAFAAVLSTATVMAHPGINERTDVLAAVHDLGHAGLLWPVAAGLIICIGLAIAIRSAPRILTMKRTRRNRPGAKPIQGN